MAYGIIEFFMAGCFTVVFSNSVRAKMAWAKDKMGQFKNFY